MPTVWAYGWTNVAWNQRWWPDCGMSEACSAAVSDGGLCHVMGMSWRGEIVVGWFSPYPAALLQ